MAKERIIGVRELRERLSDYLELVANGESLTIGTRKAAVARLVPAAPLSEGEALDRLAAEGRIQKPRGKLRLRGPVKLRKRQTKSVSDQVVEDRR
ncbi:MAG: type II toxin-antitoxin system prevent-host-death family antitoxin [Deltaproteobacteria bacterium]|nr:type II toxin-antitoxin system prevent-host-death family antitoxin [Deltaproteobacteria bacterium]